MITSQQLKNIFPNCLDPAAWAPAISEAWERFGVASKNARAGFLGITGNESGQYTSVKREDMTYSPERAAQVWKKAQAPDGGPSQTCRDKIAAGEQAFANWIYAGVVGNGDEASGDGWRFRGGGIIQLTGRSNYSACSAALEIPNLLNDSDLVVSTPGVSAGAAGWFIVRRARILDLLDKPDEAEFLKAAGMVGAPPDDDATKRRLAFRRQALAVL
jgi:putative chitinase